jgi:hypothetical protein
LKEVFRKTIHICGALVPLLLHIAYIPVLVALGAVLGFYCIAEALRYKGIEIPLISAVTAGAARKGDENHYVLGPVTLASVSFLFPALLSVSRQKQEAGRNAIILIALAGIFALLIPVNTAHILPNCTVEIGYRSILSLFTMTLYLLSFFSLLIAAWGSGREQKLIAAGYALLYAGYLILSGIQSVTMLIIGLILFSLGVYLYLSNLHRLYMWK